MKKKNPYFNQNHWLTLSEDQNHGLPFGKYAKMRLPEVHISIV